MVTPRFGIAPTRSVDKTLTEMTAVFIWYNFVFVVSCFICILKRINEMLHHFNVKFGANGLWTKAPYEIPTLYSYTGL